MPNTKNRRQEPFDVRSYARSFAPMSIKQIAALAQRANNESTRLAACIHILDRGYGKAEQSHELNADIKITIRKLFDSEIQPQVIDVIQNDSADITNADKPKLTDKQK